MGLFKRETSEQKGIKLEQQKKIEEAFNKAKYKAQLKAAKRDGASAGSKGKRSFSDKFSDGMKKFNEACNIAEEALGGKPTTEHKAPRTSRKKSSVQPIVIVIDGNKKQPQKKKSLRDELFGEMP